MTQRAPLSPKQKTFAWLVLLILLLAGTGYLLLSGDTNESDTPMRGFRGMTTSVRVVPVEQGSLDVRLRAIGTVSALNTVVVRSRVGGVLEELLFEEGAEVSKGDVLARIDAESYQAQLDQALGQLMQNEAQLENAQVDLALYQGLYAEDSIARQELDSQAALVRELKGANKSSQAQVADARLQLSWTNITAPISGRLGLRKVDAGNLITANDADGIVTITQTKPISVLFTVPEVEVAGLREAMRGDDALPVEALSRDGETVIARGVLQTLDNQIETTTGTLRARALFANDNDALFPNQFVNVRLRVKEVDNVLMVPADAVQHGSQGDYVYIVEDGVSRLKVVTLGAADGDRIVITQGLQAGDQVVLEGLDRLRDGRPVVVDGEGASAALELPVGGLQRERPAGPRPEGGRPPKDGKRATDSELETDSKNGKPPSAAPKRTSSSEA